MKQSKIMKLTSDILNEIDFVELHAIGTLGQYVREFEEYYYHTM